MYGYHSESNHSLSRRTSLFKWTTEAQGGRNFWGKDRKKITLSLIIDLTTNDIKENVSFIISIRAAAASDLILQL